MFLLERFHHHRSPRLADNTPQIQRLLHNPSGLFRGRLLKRSQSNGIVVWDRDSLMGRTFGLEDQVTALLMDYAVAPVVTLCFSEIAALEIPR